jgi:hypothetical protein
MFCFSTQIMKNLNYTYYDIVFNKKSWYSNWQLFNKWNGSKQHLTSQCVHFAFRVLYFWGSFCSKNMVHKEEFWNEIFWNFWFIVFIIVAICHAFFSNQFWINIKLKIVQILPNFMFHLEKLSQFQIILKTC